MNDDPSEISDGNEAADAARYAVQKRRIVLMLVAYSAIAGFIVCFLDEGDTLLNYALGLPWLFLGIWWCLTDAGERGYRIGIVMKFALILLFIVAFPLYLFQTRGIRGFKTLALALLLVVGMIACAAITELATVHTGAAMGVWEVAE